MNPWWLIICVLPTWLNAAPKPLPLHYTRQAPVIDGRLNEACWKKATSLRVMYPHDQTRQQPTIAPMIAQAVWDDFYLYLAYEVTDSQLTALGTGRETGPPKNRRPQAIEYAPKKQIDLVEFFIADNPRFFWELHHNAANHLNTLWIELPTAAQLKKSRSPATATLSFIEIGSCPTMANTPFNAPSVCVPTPPSTNPLIATPATPANFACHGAASSRANPPPSPADNSPSSLSASTATAAKPYTTPTAKISPSSCTTIPPSSGQR